MSDNMSTIDEIVLPSPDTAELQGQGATWNMLFALYSSDGADNIPTWKLSIILALFAIPFLLSLRGKMGLSVPLSVASVRCVVQMMILGTILQMLFAAKENLWLVILYIAVMMLIASIEAGARPSLSYPGMQVDLGACLVIPAGLALLYMILLIIDPVPWFNPQYAVPLLGMMLGNSLNGVTIGMKTMLETISSERHVIEWRLSMGASRWEALGPMYKRVLGTALTPTINMLSVAGLVSIPGMMTGQILAGGDPILAAKYQIMVLFGVSAVVATSSSASLLVSCWRLTDAMHRLRVDRMGKNDGLKFSAVWSGFKKLLSMFYSLVGLVVPCMNNSNNRGNYEQLLENDVV